MEAKRTIRSYIGPGLASAIVLGVFLLCALLCALTGRSGKEIERPAPIAFDRLETTGEEQDAFLDVIAVSEAICPFSDNRFYYVAEDDGHSFRIVCLSEEEHAALGPQREFWNNTASEPSFSRLVGRKYPIPEDVKQSFMSVFGLTSEAFDAFFGDRCLISQPAVKTTRSIGHPVGFALFLLLALLALVWLALRVLSVWSALTRLEDRDEIELAAQELVSDDTRQMNADRLRLGKSFLFGWHDGLAAAWEDVVWCYGRVFPFCNLLMVCTADGKRHPVLFFGREEKTLREFTSAVAAHNDAVLIGLSAKNRAAWQRACRS